MRINEIKITLIGVFSLLFLVAGAQVQRNRAVTLMGCRFDFTIVAEDSLTAEKHIDQVVAEIDRIEQLISDWIPESQISRVNQNAGIRPVKVDPEVWQLTRRALDISEMTGGAFDISFAALDKVWKFDGSMKKIPTRGQIRKSIKKIGYKNIELDSINSTIYLKLPGMKIGFGSIGKGYAADKAKELMVAENVPAGIINASGDISAWGKQITGKDWKIGVINPFDPADIMGAFSLQNESVTTSGSYEKYVVLKGEKYSHIINPRTGYPVRGIMSVTVIGPNAEMANGFSTSLMVLGSESGMKLMNQYPEYSCLMITNKGEILKSEHFHAQLEIFDTQLIPESE
ncbi:FAD:protein FMN transferase [Apibacter sp. HY039]|uniref:FAD:protein FMN transferase n=1 Tax=Apibacter sp. HY039 TaxID=2501476 RepID=UPI002103DC70|nr:FAD:protein FMN transferase [Apibacter sp. HY039]